MKIAYVYDAVCGAPPHDPASPVRAYPWIKGGAERRICDKMRTDLRTTGMEFASEMLEVAIKNNLKIAEVPITYYPRPEESEPNLHSFSDGWRHLKHILLRVPTLLFLIPGFILFALGVLLVFLIWAPFNLWAIRLGIHSIIAGCLLAIVGYQIIFLGLFAKTYGVHHSLSKRDRITEFVSKHVTLARGSTLGLVVFLLGFIFALKMLMNWVSSGYKNLPVLDQDIAGLTLLVIGLQTVFYSFFLSVIGGGE